MSKASLVIMAAGMGSRYGGVKQIAGVGPHGEILMEYAIYDAIRAGFDKVVFIVTEALVAGLKEKFGDALSRKGVEVAYAVQDYSSLPSFHQVPKDRVKSYGTAHAVLCARSAVKEPFAVINADDYYGTDAFRAIYEALPSLSEKRACMVGYKLRNTVSEHGTVTRGVCTVADDKLSTVTETFKIACFPDGTIRDTAQDPEGKLLDGDAVVSMNFWGFHPSIFAALEDYLDRFLHNLAPGDLKSECLLPALVDERIRSGALSVDVLHTDARWFGMTYKEDHPLVQAEIARLHTEGVYPPVLW